MDLFAACEQDVTIGPGQTKAIPCGFYVAVAPGYEAQVRARSGLDVREGIIVPNAPGAIDSDYRGEVCAILGNIAREPFTVTRGMRIAQMIIALAVRADLEEVDELDQTERGDGGFGHTGQ